MNVEKNKDYIKIYNFFNIETIKLMDINELDFYINNYTLYLFNLYQFNKKVNPLLYITIHNSLRLLKCEIRIKLLFKNI